MVNCAVARWVKVMLLSVFYGVEWKMIKWCRPKTPNYRSLLNNNIGRCRRQKQRQQPVERMYTQTNMTTEHHNVYQFLAELLMLHCAHKKIVKNQAVLFHSASFVLSSTTQFVAQPFALWPLLKHTTTLFSLSDHYILSREWRVIVDQVQTNYHGRPVVLKSVRCDRAVDNEGSSLWSDVF